VAGARSTETLEGLDRVSAVHPRVEGFLSMTDADFEASLQLNFFAALRATRAAVADMLERRAVAAAVEAEADRVAGAGRLRCGAVPAGVGALGVEARDAGGLTDDLGRGQRAAAGDREQRRS